LLELLPGEDFLENGGRVRRGPRARETQVVEAEEGGGGLAAEVDCVQAILDSTREQDSDIVDLAAQDPFG